MGRIGEQTESGKRSDNLARCLVKTLNQNKNDNLVVAFALEFRLKTFELVQRTLKMKQ